MRTIAVVIYVFFATIFTYPARIYNNIKYKDSKKAHDANFYMLKKIAVRILQILDIKVEVTGTVDFEEKTLRNPWKSLKKT